MISAGNDIVALNAINITRTKRQKFYSKILSPEEKELYGQPGFTGIPFENFVWLLWSIKESAYKYLKRHSPGLVFIPVKFIVTELLIPPAYSTTNFNGTQAEGSGFAGVPVLKGKLETGAETIYSNSLIYHECIHSVVNSDDNFENINWGIKLTDSVDANRQSAEVRFFLIDRLKKRLNVTALTMDKNLMGIPIVLKDGEEITSPVSLSHHGQFVGYAFQFKY